MVAISSPAILRLAAGATTAYYSIERATRLLIAVDRWPHRGRRQLRAGDLASILNAIMGSITDAVGTDDLLRGLQYKSSIPPTAEQEPALGTGNWGQVLERLIEGAPPELHSGVPARKDANFRGVMPNTIECCLNPPSILLVWLGPDGATRQRIDIYGPSADDTQLREPYGPASWLIRKSFMDSNMIVLAGRILRDSSQKRTTPRNETAAAPGRATAARKPGPPKTPGSSNTPETSRARERAQRESDPGPSSPFTPEKTIDRRSHSIDRRDAHSA